MASGGADLRTRSFSKFSTKVLVNHVDKYSNQLNELLDTDPHTAVDSAELKALCFKIKEIKSLYNKYSRELSTKYLKEAATEEAYKVSSERHNLTLECQSIIDIVNTLLVNAGDGAMSSISVSTFKIPTSEPSENFPPQKAKDVTAAERVADYLKATNNQEPECPQANAVRPKEPLKLAKSSQGLSGIEKLGNLDQVPHYTPFQEGYNLGPRNLFNFPKVKQPESIVGRENRPEIPRPFLNNTRSSFPLSGTVDPNLNYNMSRLMLTQDLFKNSIGIFDGTAHRFWHWIEQIQARIQSLNLSNTEVLRVMESHTSGPPNEMLINYMSGSGSISDDYFNEIWDTFVERFGSQYKIAEQLMEKLKKFPVIKGQNIGKQLEQLHDLCRIICFNIPNAPELEILNLASGTRTPREKLPRFLQDRWRTNGQNYEDENAGRHPPFHVFVEFLKKNARELCNANYEQSPPSERRFTRALYTQAEISSNSSYKEDNPNLKFCPLHNAYNHSLDDCKVFLKMSHQEKKKKIMELQVCFLCFQDHMMKDCVADVRCEICEGKHATLMHINNTRRLNLDQKEKEVSNTHILCTAQCGNKLKMKNCSKTVLVDIFLEDKPQDIVRGYVIIDDQSNCTLADPKLMKSFDKEFPEEEYALSSVNSFEVVTKSHVMHGICVRGVKEEKIIKLPPTFVNDSIPDTRHEVAKPTDVLRHKHIAHLAHKFPKYEPRAELLMLIGRDCEEAMQTNCTSLGTPAPFVHHTSLGYALVGVTSSPSRTLNMNSMSVNHYHNHDHFTLKKLYPDSKYVPFDQTLDLFQRFKDDNLPGYSQEDLLFLKMMKENVTINKKGRIEVPIPLKDANPLPDNRQAVEFRTKAMLKKLKKTPEKLQQCKISIQKDIDAGYIEQVKESDVPLQGYSWWLPIFPVNHPRKPDTRLVFDASARYGGTSLNDRILTGPDINNPLRAVLLRFREKKIGFVADIQAMFKNFMIPEGQKDLLRFFWYQDNDEKKKVTEYRGTTHMFGCSSSPAVATYCLRYAADLEDKVKYPLSNNFIKNNMYVDDGLGCADSINEAIEILKYAILILNKYGIRLHKILASSAEVLLAFPESERTQGCHKLEITDVLPTQRTLGILWHSEEDSFVIKVELPNRRFTKRGILSVTNSLFDPLGFVTPVTLTARLIQRQILPPKKYRSEELESYGWDDDLPDKYLDMWENWKGSLSNLSYISIPRCYVLQQFQDEERELHVFADASDNAIGYVIYMRSVNQDGRVHVAFVSAGTKVAPQGATTIPRLELCAAMHAAVNTNEVLNQLTSKPKGVTYYSDSQVVLGYLNNTQRRFQRYVARRIEMILHTTSIKQWKYINTSENPADIASRPHTPEELKQSRWFSGPLFLCRGQELEPYKQNLDSALPEEQPVPTTLVTKMCMTSSINELCLRLNNWTRVLRVVVLIISLAKRIDACKQKIGISIAQRNPQTTEIEASRILVRLAQRESYLDALKCLQRGKHLPENHSLADLSPFLDSEGLLRVGGRIHHAAIPADHKHPLLLPENHPVTSLIIDSIHRGVCHQGRHLTHGAVRQNGYHIVNGRKVVKKLIADCSACHKLRGIPLNQLMADIPPDRLEECPPFTNSGLDVFGPFFIHDGKSTRRNAATKKVWVVIFVCLVSRCIHVELLPGMDTSSMRNAIFRFMAIRGVCKIFRSDNGSNFVSTQKQMQKEKSVNINQIQSELEDKNCEWIFSPPMASNFSGAWERKIGSVRRVFEGSMLAMNGRNLSRDEFHTLLLEVSAIVNNTPLWETSTHPDDPAPLCPAALLTLREAPNPSTLEFSESDLLQYGKMRWRRVQYLAQQFWVRYRRDYLHTLQRRHKWRTRTPCIASGDVVLVCNKTEKRNFWPMARVVEVVRSKDNLVRKVYIKIPGKNELLLRSIHQLILVTKGESHGDCKI